MPADDFSPLLENETGFHSLDRRKSPWEHRRGSEGAVVLGRDREDLCGEEILQKAPPPDLIQGTVDGLALGITAWRLASRGEILQGRSFFYYLRS